MATVDISHNKSFPIYVDDANGNKTSFHGLVLKKSTYESSVMSLGDKVSGDVYYKDNTLTFSMQEYIEFAFWPTTFLPS